MIREIELMETDDGKCESLEFIEKQNDKTQRKIEFVFKLVEDLDIVPTEYLKKRSTKLKSLERNILNNFHNWGVGYEIKRTS